MQLFSQETQTSLKLESYQLGQILVTSYNCMKANQKTTTEKKRSKKMPAIKLHLFLRAQDCDCLIALTTKNTLYLKVFHYQQEETFENQTAIPTDNAIEIVAGNNKDVYLLCKEGILMWYLDEIKAKASPKKMYYQWPATPRKLLHIANSQFAVICCNQAILFVKNGEITQKITYPLELDMVKLSTSHSANKHQDSLVLVPSSSNKLPYVFKLHEVLEWKQEAFFSKYLVNCQQYYLEDEALTQKTDIFCFSATSKLVYLCLSKHLLVFEIKQGALSNIPYVLKLKIRLNMRWNQYPFSCTVNEETGSFAYVGVERIGECNPTKYTLNSRSIKQRNESSGLIRIVSYTRHDEIVMLAPNTTECKLYVSKMDQIQ